MQLSAITNMDIKEWLMDEEIYSESDNSDITEEVSQFSDEMVDFDKLSEFGEEEEPMTWQNYGH